MQNQFFVYCVVFRITEIFQIEVYNTSKKNTTLTEETVAVIILLARIQENQIVNPFDMYSFVNMRLVYKYLSTFFLCHGL